MAWNVAVHVLLEKERPHTMQHQEVGKSDRGIDLLEIALEKAPSYNDVSLFLATGECFIWPKFSYSHILSDDKADLELYQYFKVR